MTGETETDFQDVNDRLKEIAEAVQDDQLPLDDALGLFEEAVQLGMQASSLMEQNIADRNAAEDLQDEAAEAASSDDSEPTAQADSSADNNAVSIDDDASDAPVEGTPSAGGAQ